MIAPRSGLVALVDAWLEDKAGRGGGLSANSALAYRRDLALIADTIADLRGAASVGDEGLSPPDRRLGRIDLDELTDDNLAAAMTELVANGYAAASRSRALAAMRGFTHWLVSRGHLGRDPLLEFENPKADQGLPVAFSQAELARLLVAASNPDPRYRITSPERDVALIAMLAGAGVRATELIEMTVGAIVRDEPYRVRVRGKGRKERVVPIDATVLAVVDHYLVTRHAPPPPNELLFVRNDGRPFTIRSLGRVIERWMMTAGVASRPGEKAHAFRHTYAIGQVDSGTAVHELQQLLGHSYMNTTAIYLRASAEGLHHAAAAAPITGLLRERDSDASAQK